MLSIEDCWAFLESCLGDGASELPTGAHPKSLTRAEETMGVTLPDDFRRFLSRHNGSGPCYLHPYKIGGGQQWLLGLTEVLYMWREMAVIEAECKDHRHDEPQIGPVKQMCWNCRWIALTDNKCGDNIFIDLDPDEGGQIGQIVDWHHSSRVSTWLAPGLREWLNEVVDDIRDGAYQFCKNETGWYPLKSLHDV